MLALIGGATAAFTITEALKLERSPVGKPRFRDSFSPTCECGKRAARLSFRLRMEDELDAVVVDSEERPVRTLVSGEERSAGRTVFSWDGRTDAGSLAPDGSYRLRVQLAEVGRTILFPDVFRLDTQPPRAELVGLAPRILSPDGNGRRDAAAVTYSLSETARAFVLVDGNRAQADSASDAGTFELTWPGTVRGDALRAGTYVVAVQARDRAGNVSSPSSGLTVRIRYVELARSRYKARDGGVLRFRVSSDGEAFSWRIQRRRRVVLAGEGEPGGVSVRLPRRLEHGRYILRVEANGHSARAVLVIRRNPGAGGAGRAGG